MMLRLLLALLLGLGGSAAAAQGQDSAPGVWERGGRRVVHGSARLSLPDQAGPARLHRMSEFSRPGEGLDTGLQYWTQDEQVFATVYVYYPGMPHAGLTAYATDQAIASQSQELRRLGRGVVDSGDRDRAAIRADYSGYRDGMASSAAFLKVGRWIVKLRVSGPEARRADVERTMADLLSGMRFEGEAVPREPEPVEVGTCSGRYSRAAAMLPSDASDALQEAVIGVLDGSGENGREASARHEAATPLVGAAWCLSTRARLGQVAVPILRAEETDLAREGLRTLAVALIGDSGTMLEVVRDRRRERFVVLLHQIGVTHLLGAFDGAPSDEQIAAIVTGSDPVGGARRATIVHKSDGNTDITLHVEPPPQAAPTT